MATDSPIPDTLDEFLENVENAVYRIATNPNSSNTEVLRAAIILFKRYEVGSFSKAKPDKPARLPALPPLGPTRDPIPHPRYTRPAPSPVETLFQDLDEEMGMDHPEDLETPSIPVATQNPATTPIPETIPIPLEPSKPPPPSNPITEFTIQQIPIPPPFLVPQKNYFPSSPKNPFYRRAISKPKKPKTPYKLATPDTS